MHISAPGTKSALKMCSLYSSCLLEERKIMRQYASVLYLCYVSVVIQSVEVVARAFKRAAVSFVDIIECDGKQQNLFLQKP